MVTTRRRDAALAGHPHLLGDAEGAAREMGYLPLALAQAVAYMLERGLSCADYRARLADWRRRLGSLLPDAEGSPDRHRMTVAATGSLSVEHANQLVPVAVAGPLLELASLLDANGMPAEVFGTPAAQQMLTDRTGRAVSGDDARAGLSCLHRLSLIALDPCSASRTVRVHALVQRATRDSVADHLLPVLVRVAAEALVQVWPEVERDTQSATPVRAAARRA